MAYDGLCGCQGSFCCLLILERQERGGERDRSGEGRRRREGGREGGK